METILRLAKTKKKWWLSPIIVMAFILGSAIVIAQISAQSPFLSAMF
ncbi:MAG: hypothetical protein CO189_06635 [candidate division Zixibacteria bacterium CG_4_9_14_3_um_filter_46_8]|nr:MAG: hypothetical protein CO189_06635 [candidate division Zixibacteria bacterium CG_4_9_14_3_um_filter_46_8]